MQLQECEMIAVTGATGRTGRRVTETLLAKGEKVRAVGRDAKKLAPLAELGAEPFVGNAEDVSSVTKAFAGASGTGFRLLRGWNQKRERAICG